MVDRKPGFTAAVIGAAALLAFSACTGDPTAGEGSSSVSNGQPITVGVTIHQADQYFQTVAAGVDEAVKASGGSTILVNTQADAATEATGFQNLISRQVSGIVASPLSPTGSLASVKSASEAGIPVVCYNTCLSEEDNKKYVKAFIQSDQADLGTQTGEYAVADLKARGVKEITLGMLNCNRYEACKQRQDGFLAALKASGLKVNVVANQEALAPDEATKKATDILTANTTINVFWSSSQGSSEGMVSAIKAAGKTADISAYGTDVSTTLVQAIKNGELRALTGQDAIKTGELSVEYIKMAIAGQEIPKFSTLIPGVLYDADHIAAIDAYLAANK